MAPRPTWKGYLKLSLVSCSVAMFTATTTAERIRFHIINRKTENRIRNEVVDSETGDPVEPEDRIKGFPEGKGYILLEDEELDEVALESTHTLEIDAFIPREEVDEIYLDESFYIVPNDEVAQEAFAVIREAMRHTGMVGLGKVVMHRRERLLMLQARDKGILATALRYRNEVRDEHDYFDDVPSVRIPNDMLKLAEHILETKKAHFDPDKFKDRYEQALQELIKAKRAGKPPPSAPEPPPSNVIDLMEALRRSVKEGRGGRAAGAKASAGKASADKARKTRAAKPTTAKRKLKRAS